MLLMYMSPLDFFSSYLEGILGRTELCLAWYLETCWSLDTSTMPGPECWVPGTPLSNVGLNASPWDPTRGSQPLTRGENQCQHPCTLRYKVSGWFPGLPSEQSIRGWSSSLVLKTGRGWRQNPFSGQRSGMGSFSLIKTQHYFLANVGCLGGL